LFGNGLSFANVNASFTLCLMASSTLSKSFSVAILSYVWVALVGIIFLGETLLVANWLGIGLIVMGVSMVGYGGKHG